MPGHVDGVIFRNAGIFRFLKIRRRYFFLRYSGNPIILHIADKSIFRQHFGPVTNIFRLFEHIHHGSLVHICQNRTLNTRFPAYSCLLLCSYHIFISKLCGNPYAIGFFIVLINKIRIIQEKICSHISIASIGPQNHISGILTALCHGVGTFSHCSTNQFFGECIEILIFFFIPVKTGINILIDRLHMKVYFSINESGHISYHLIINHHCHVLVTGQSEILLQICHFLGRRIFFIQKFSCKKSSYQEKQQQRRQYRNSLWIQFFSSSGSPTRCISPFS